jgi:hypothetical protein
MEDGTPGGDDSMAYGYFNLIRVMGVDDPWNDFNGQSGLFGSLNAFCPFYNGRTFYLRLWEGKDCVSAPYYQNTIEYSSGEDRGGSMIRLFSASSMSPPIDVDFKFGPSKPRPKSTKQ